MLAVEYNRSAEVELVCPWRNVRVQCTLAFEHNPDYSFPWEDSATAAAVAAPTAAAAAVTWTRVRSENGRG